MPILSQLVLIAQTEMISDYYKSIESV